MTRRELINAIAELKEKIAGISCDEVTDYARYEVYIDLDAAIDHLEENEEREDWYW